MLQKWRDHGAITYAGYILGFPGDTKESILRDIEIIKRELPLDILEFFFLTPLPGSEDHKVLLQKGVWMDPDMNKYDLNHRVSHHPKMSDAEWEEAYRAAWEAFYTPEHVRTILRRVGGLQGRPAGDDARHDPVVLSDDPVRRRASARRRRLPPEVPPRPPASALRAKIRWSSIRATSGETAHQDAGAIGGSIGASRPCSTRRWRRRTAGPTATSRSRRRRPTSSRRSISITRPRGGEAALARKRRDDAIRGTARARPRRAGDRRCVTPKQDARQAVTTHRRQSE